MSFWIYFWIYTLSIIIIWWFFIVAKIHSLKFKSYQPKIIWLTNILTIVLSIMSIIWYVLIFIFTGEANTYDLKNTVTNNWKIESEIWNFSDISEKDELIPIDAGENYY